MLPAEMEISMTHDWLLLFPPLVSSNWGSYYPSTAILAAALDAQGFSVQQRDLNEEFLDFLLCPKILGAIENGDWPVSGTVGTSLQDQLETLPLRSAAQILRRKCHDIVDKNGRHLSQENNDSYTLIVELSRPFHIDLSVQEIVSPAFIDGPLCVAYDEFFSTCDLSVCLERIGDGIGISVPMGPQLAPAILLAKKIKSLKPDLRVVLGGSVFTLMEDATLKLLLSSVPAIDVVVRFQGEDALVGLAQQCREGDWRPLEIANTHVAGEVTERQRVSRKLKDTAYADYAPELLDRLVSPRLSVQQARGCYWGKCSYCDFVELFNTGLHYDGRRTNSVINEVQYQIENHGVSRFWLVTEALPPKVALQFSSNILKAGLDVDWRSFAMVDPEFTIDILRTMRRSGCSCLTIGLESMTTRALINVEKRATCEDNLVFLENIRQSGLKIDINLIPDLPTTTAHEAMEGLDLIRQFTDIFRTVSIFPFEATRSSQIGRDPERFGLEICSAGDAGDKLFPKGQAQFSSNRLKYKDRGMTDGERKDVMSAYMSFARQTNLGDSRRSNGGVGDQNGTRRYSLRTPDVAIFETKDGVFVYDWGRDRAWELPPVANDILTWMVNRPEGADKRDIANFLHCEVNIPMDCVPDSVSLLMEALVRMELVTPSICQVGSR